MNRVITINLNGIAYQLEESGYEALRTYLDNAARRLEGNPDKDEIMADIEQAMADKFRAVLGANKTVVVTKEVTEAINEMGPVEASTADDKSANTSGADAATSTGKEKTDGENNPNRVRRLYRIEEGAMLNGVCTGLAAFWAMDVRTIRWIFFGFCFCYGIGAVAYLLLSFIVPAAQTFAEKSAAGGTASATAQEFIRRAKAGYYEGMKTLHDKRAHREWKRKFKQEMRGWKQGFKRDMHENARQWQQTWSHPWGLQPNWVGMGFTLLILKWVKLLCFVLGIYAVYSLATKGGVFGVALPAGIPKWVGIIGVLMLYQFLTWPIKALKYSCYCQGMSRGGCGPWMVGPLSWFVWFGFIVVLVWLADHYMPQIHEALK